MLFGKSKLKKINEANKNIVLSMIQSDLRSCENDDFRQKLYDLSSNIKNQSVGASAESFECFAKIYKYLLDIGSDLSKKYYRVADIRLGKLKTIVSDLGRLAAAGDTSYLKKGDRKYEELAKKKMEKYMKKDAFEDVVANFKPEDLYTENEKIKLEQNALQDACDLEQRKYEALQAALEKNPYDQTIIADMQVCEQNIRSYTERLNTFGKERVHSSIENSLEKNKQDRERLISERTRSSDETKMLINDYKNVKRDYDNVTLTPEKLEEMLGDEGEETDVSKGTASRGAGAAHAAASAGSGSFLEGYEPTGNPAVDKIRQEHFLKKQHERLKEAIKQADRDVDRLQDKVQECDEELKEIDGELTPLLEERRGLSPTRRLALDSRIDVLYAKRNGKIREMKELNQRISILTSQRGVFTEMERKQTRKEQEKAGVFTLEEIRAMAQEVDKMVKDYNQQLEDANDAYIVAHSTDIEWGTAGGISQTESASDYSNDEKYFELEKELGLEFPKKK